MDAIQVKRFVERDDPLGEIECAWGELAILAAQTVNTLEVLRDQKLPPEHRQLKHGAGIPQVLQRE